MKGADGDRSSKEGLRDVMTELMRYGIVILKNAPARKGIVEGNWSESFLVEQPLRLRISPSPP